MTDSKRPGTFNPDERTIMGSPHRDFRRVKTPPVGVAVQIAVPEAIEFETTNPQIPVDDQVNIRTRDIRDRIAKLEGGLQQLIAYGAASELERERRRAAEDAKANALLEHARIFWPRVIKAIGYALALVAGAVLAKVLR